MLNRIQFIFVFKFGVKVSFSDVENIDLRAQTPIVGIVRGDNLLVFAYTQILTPDECFAQAQINNL